MAWVKLARQIDTKVITLLVRILFRILTKIVPLRKMVAAMLLQSNDQFRINMQERAKKFSDTELNEVIEGFDQNRPWPGKSEEYHKELEEAGLLSVILKALEDEKFLREYNSNKKQ